MRVILLRHGETTWNAMGKMQGDLNSPLSETGQAQARAVGPALAAFAPDHIETSDLDRTIDTARLAGFPDGIRKRAWREMNMGDWAGQMRADVLSHDEAGMSAWRLGKQAAPNGETLAQLVARIGGALEDLPRDAERVLVVAHGLVIKAALVHLFGQRYDQIAGVINCSMTEVDWEVEDRPRLVHFNDVRWTL